jgi:hypothetical protein
LEEQINYPKPIFASDGSQRPQDGQFYNIYPDDSPDSVLRFELLNTLDGWTINIDGKLQQPQSDTYTFITQNGKIYIGQGREPFHIDLARAEPVNYAGELRIAKVEDKMQVTEWSNSSGHYKPSPDYKHLANLPEDAFRDTSKWFLF